MGVLREKAQMFGALAAVRDIANARISRAPVRPAARDKRQECARFVNDVIYAKTGLIDEVRQLIGEARRAGPWFGKTRAQSRPAARDREIDEGERRVRLDEFGGE